jgi:polyisoprenoid-binding protein YceI
MSNTPRRPSRLAAAALIALPTLAAADSFVIDSRHTFPSFEVSHIGFSTQRGRFDRTSGKIQLDSVNKTGTVHVAIDAASIDTGLSELEDRLKKDDFFNVGKFPTIAYDADKIVFQGDQPTRAEGSLTLLGVTKPLTLSIEHFHCGIHPIALKNVCGADATGTIKRGDFGLSAFLPVVGDEVKILIQVEAFKE